MSEPSVHPSQYDAIAHIWQLTWRLPIRVFEIDNQRQINKPLIEESIAKNGETRILDMASGSGDYARFLLSWGATSVFGLDISDGMIAMAQKTARDAGYPESRLQFGVADCSDPEAVAAAVGDRAPFDMAFAGWLLHYSATDEQLVRMWSIIANNLKPGGKFVTILPNPFLDTKESWNASNARWRKYGGTFTTLDTIEEGTIFPLMHCCLHVSDPAYGMHDQTKEDANWKCYLITNAVERYERTAREGGMKGKFEVRRAVYPDEPTGGTLEYEKSSGEGKAYWDAWIGKTEEEEKNGFDGGAVYGFIVAEK